MVSLKLKIMFFNFDVWCQTYDSIFMFDAKCWSRDRTHPLVDDDSTLISTTCVSENVCRQTFLVIASNWIIATDYRLCVTTKMTSFLGPFRDRISIDFWGPFWTPKYLSKRGRFWSFSHPPWRCLVWGGPGTPLQGGTPQGGGTTPPTKVYPYIYVRPTMTFVYSRIWVHVCSNGVRM